MAWENPVHDISLPAGADLSGSQYFIVAVNANGEAVLAGAGAIAIGVLQNKPGLGQSAQVRVLGETKMVAGAAINRGQLIAADAAGKAKVAVPASTNTSDAGVAQDPLIGSYVLGVALTPAAAANEVITAALLHLGAVPTTEA